jgi:hypothetical protein
VAHKGLQCYEVPTALAQEAVCEAVTQLVRRELPDTGALADTPDHSHQRLVTGRLLRILESSFAFERRDPLFDFDRENVVV